MFDRTGRTANRVGLHGPSRGEVARLYDWLPARRVGEVARDIAALRLKNRAVIAVVGHDGVAHLSTLVRWQTANAWTALFDGNGGKVVLVGHVGVFFGLRAAFHAIGRPVLMLRDLPMEQEGSRAAALMRSVDYVRHGGVVVATIDGPGGTSTRDVECLGRRIVLRRGPFVLARLTGAPLIPVVCSWTTRGQILVRIAPPIQRPVNGFSTAADFENDMAARTAHWLDEYLRAEPQEIWLSTLRHYLAAPRAFDRNSALGAPHERSGGLSGC